MPIVDLTDWAPTCGFSVFQNAITAGGVCRALNAKKANEALEKVCVATVESGYMTKDLALLVGADQRWLSTTGFLDKVAENLTKAMAA